MKTTKIAGPRPRRGVGRSRAATRLSRERRLRVQGQRDRPCRAGLHRPGRHDHRRQGDDGDPRPRERAQPSLLGAGQQGADRGIWQRQAGPELALRIPDGVRPQSRGCRTLDQGGAVRAPEERRHDDLGSVDGARRLGRRPRLDRHPRRRLPDDAPGRVVHQERPHGGICLGREGRRRPSRIR